MKFKAVIFDFDGTLVDTCADIALCINEMLSHYGYENKTNEQVKAALCFGPVKLVYNVLPSEVANDSKLLDECVEFYRGKYNVSENKLTYPYDGIINLLTVLKENGIKIAINTNKNSFQTRNIVSGIFADETFDKIVGFSDSRPAKPNPCGALMIANELGIEPCDIVYIGDSHVDIKTAKNAGMSSVGVSWGYRSRDVLEKENPDYIADNVAQLSEYILSNI